jgi:dolichyl-phosphate beta-glucosyltransferase
MRDVCLIVPCFNEEKRLQGDRITGFVGAHPAVRVCFVDDGSSDGTVGLLERLRAKQPDRILIRRLERNSGKAEAVRQGVLHVSSSQSPAFIGYWDADLSTPLSELERMLAAFDSGPQCRLAIGSRIKRLGSNIERNEARHYLGRVFSTLASRLLDLPVYDSQCGAKVFRADLAAVLFGDPFSTRWIFDVEVLARLRNHIGRDGVLKTVIEVPLTEWREVGGSKLRLAQMIRVPLELLRIRSRYNKATRE